MPKTEPPVYVFEMNPDGSKGRLKRVVRRRTIDWSDRRQRRKALRGLRYRKRR